MSKRIIVTGATGLIGRNLCPILIERGDELTLFTTHRKKAESAVPGAKEYVEWDYNNLDRWKDIVEGKDAIIHLAGANLFGKRWSAEYKNTILQSREVSTQNLVKAASLCRRRPSSFIAASAVDYYPDSGNEILTEDSQPGESYLSEVCKKWEEEAAQSEKLGLRRVSVRTGIVLSKEDGALKQMLLPFKLFAGGPLGNGSQWFPWVHLEDVLRIYLYALDNTIVNGPLNACSPKPVTMNEFAAKLGRVLERPSFFKVPYFALKLAVGEIADVIVASHRVIPVALSKGGYKFKFENLEDALKDLL